MYKSRLSFCIIFTSFVLFIISFASSASSVNATSSEEAANCLKVSKDLMNQMVSENLTVLRINDTLSQAESIYKGQLVLKERNRDADFSLVISFCNDIKKINDLALESKDSFATLLRFYNESITSEMNASSVDKIINEINFEMQSERYEKVQPLIDSAYQEISDVKARSTTLNLFMDSTTRGLKSFLLKNWKIIVGVLIFLMVSWFAFKTPIKIKLLKYDLEKLARRRESIKKLIMKTQQDYFHTGKIADSDYKIRVANYAELVRDIDRQVPLLKEELAKLGGRD